MKPGRQQGVMLLEALVAILIFSIGILAIVGMQASAVRAVTDSRSRSEASFYANQLIAQIWVDARYATDYAFDGGTPSARLTPWLNQVKAALPGAETLTPKVTVTNATSAGADVQVEIYWRTPEETKQGAEKHTHFVRASVFTNN